MWFIAKVIMVPLFKEIDIRHLPCLEAEIEKLRKTLDPIRDVVTGVQSRIG